ncbi:hypothetical protein D3C86_1399120 [compost metagenome]
MGLGAMPQTLPDRMRPQPMQTAQGDREVVQIGRQAAPPHGRIDKPALNEVVIVVQRRGGWGSGQAFVRGLQRQPVLIVSGPPGSGQQGRDVIQFAPRQSNLGQLQRYDRMARRAGRSRQGMIQRQIEIKRQSGVGGRQINR